MINKSAQELLAHQFIEKIFITRDNKLSSSEVYDFFLTDIVKKILPRNYNLKFFRENYWTLKKHNVFLTEVKDIFFFTKITKYQISWVSSYLYDLIEDIEYIENNMIHANKITNKIFKSEIIDSTKINNYKKKLDKQWKLWMKNQTKN